MDDQTLKALDGVYEKTPAGSGSGDAAVPDGIYTAEVVEAECFDTKEGRPCLRIRFQIVEDALSGAIVSIIHGIDKPERFKFMKKDLFCLGIHAKPSELAGVIGQAVGKVCEIAVRNKDYNGKNYVNVYLNGVVREGTAPLDSVPF